MGLPPLVGPGDPPQIDSNPPSPRMERGTQGVRPPPGTKEYLVAVKIVTDSTSDIPPDQAESLGITVVPCNVIFGMDSYKDGVDLSAEKFYERLIDGAIFPTTSQPSPGDFVETYEQLGQDAAWAIRTYIETRPDSDAMDAVSDELKALRDQMAEYANNAEGADAEALQARLTEIGEGIDTLSGAPVADSIALRAAAQIDGTPAAYKTAAETLTIGLSAAN